MPVAEIITIGTELLLGEIQDTNTHFLARNLRDIGVDLYRTTTVGDNLQRIAQVIRESLERCDIILTTGGLGPTVDDPTRQAVADALGVELVYLPELWEMIEQRFKRYGREASDNNRRQAYIPAGAEAIQNPVGTAPAFIARQASKVIICLPGVPREMEQLYTQAVFPYLQSHYQLTNIIKARVLHTASIGESYVDEVIGELEMQSNPTVGLLANPGRVDIRITAKGDSADEVDALIAHTEAIIRKKLGKSIYGQDDETLEQATLIALIKKQLSAILILHGFGGDLFERLLNSAQIHINLQPEPLSPDLLDERWQEVKTLPAAIILLATFLPKDDKFSLEIIHQSPEGEKRLSRSFGGPSQMAPLWAENTCLDCIRLLSLN
jgi:nicotinamide-nucleotide amidase